MIRLIISCFAFNMLCAANAHAQGIPDNSISITYSNSFQKNSRPDFSARINNTNDALNGVAYNYGNTISYNISSPLNYTVRISSMNESSNSFSGGMMKPGTDIRNYIFYNIVDNNTGGRSIGGGMQPLGTEEKTLLSSCPPTRAFTDRPENHYRSFSLSFRAQVGYSIPPGNYITAVVVTATTE